MATTRVPTYEEAQARKKRDTRSMFWKKIVLPVAGFATGGAALAAGGGAAAGGAAAASVPGAVGASAAPLGVGSVAGGAAAGGGMAASVPWLKLSEIGAGAGMNLYGQRSANRAGDRAARIEQDAMTRQEALMQQQIEREERAWAADQEQRRIDREAAEEERRFNREEREYSRSEREYARRLLEEKEARRAPYRQWRQEALMSLASIAGINLPRSGAPGGGSRGPVSNTMPIGSARAITPAGQEPYRPRLIPLGQVG